MPGSDGNGLVGESGFEEEEGEMVVGDVEEGGGPGVGCLSERGGGEFAVDAKAADAADDFFLGRLVEHGGRSSKLCHYIARSVRISDTGNFIGGHLPARVVLIDLLDQADFAAVEPAIGDGHGHHGLQCPVCFRAHRSVRHQMLCIVPSPAANCPKAQALCCAPRGHSRKRAFEAAPLVGL